MLKECGVALCDEYDLAMLDLDGVVYIGSSAVDGAPEHLQAASASGLHLAYITNNAARPPSAVVEHLRALGIAANDEDVVTSAQAAARLVAQQVPTGTAVFVIGGDGLFDALAEQGLTAVQSISDEPAAVVSGYHPDLQWKTVINGAILVKRGLPWVASNTDLIVPTAHGPGPGNGVLVDAVARYAGRAPVVAGKPQRPLFEETIRRVGGKKPVVVGDRLDTDIEGAVNSGFDSLLVMTGVTDLGALVSAGTEMRPSYISADLGGLTMEHPVPAAGDRFSLNGWVAEVEGGALVVHGEGNRDDWWRVVASAGWSHLDAHGEPVDVSALAVPR